MTLVRTALYALSPIVIPAQAGIQAVHQNKTVMAGFVPAIHEFVLKRGCPARGLA